MRTIVDDGAQITTLTGKQLVEEYNERAAALQEPLVKRFATRSAAERRVLAIAERYNAAHPEKAATKEDEPKPPPAGRGRSTRSRSARPTYPGRAAFRRWPMTC